MTDEQRRRWVVPPRTGTFQEIELEYLDPGNPDERRILIEAEHPEYADALEAEEDVLVDGQPVNPALHVSMHEIVANQIWDLDPPETWATAQRLMGLGYDRHEILHMLSGAVATQVWRAMHEQQPFALDASSRIWTRSRSRGKSNARRRLADRSDGGCTSHRGGSEAAGENAVRCRRRGRLPGDLG